MRLTRIFHAWSGAFLSLILIVLGLSGALLVWKDDYVRATVPQAQTGIALDPNSLGEAVGRATSIFGAEDVRSVVFGRSDLGVHRVYLRKSGAAYLDGDGKLIARWDGQERFEDWVFDLHHHLLSGETGKTAAGIAGTAAILLSITGFFISLPSLRMFSGRIWPRRAAKRDLLAAHRDLGLILALPIIIAASTGALMVFDDIARPAFTALTPQLPQPKLPDAGVGQVNWPLALSRAQAVFPKGQIRIAILPKSAGAPVIIRIRNPGEWHVNGRSQVSIDPATHAIMSTLDATKAGRGEQAWNAIWPVHAAKVGDGSFGERLVDVATTLTGLALAGLGIFGLWAFLIKQSKKRQVRLTNA